MLKLEKKGRQEGICVILHQCPPFFNKCFLKAFLIALAMHLTGFILFSIDLVRFPQGDRIHPPVLLQIDFTPAQQEMVAELDREFGVKFSLEPKLSSLEYPSPPLPTFALNLSPLPSAALLPMPLVSPSIENALLSEMRPPQFLIRFSGPLAEYASWELEPDGLLLLSAFLKEVKAPKEKQAVYKIEVEDSRIFWYQNQSPSGSELNSWMAALLPYFKFNPKKGFSHLMGNLELTLP